MRSGGGAAAAPEADEQVSALEAGAYADLGGQDPNAVAQQQQQPANSGPAAALLNAIDEALRDGTWPAIRTRMYAQLAAPIQQRSDERRAGTRPDITGIGSINSIDTFVAAVKQIQGNWGSLTARQRAKAMFDAANDALHAAGVPKMKVVDIADMVPRGMFTPSTWKFTLRDQTMNAASLSNDEAAEVADTTLHEARHCEQQFRVCRWLAGQGKTARQIQREEHVPADIARKAHRQPLDSSNGTATELQEASDWHDSMTTNAAASSQTSQNVIDQIHELETRHATLEQKRAAVAANPTDATAISEAQTACNALRTQITAVEQAYQAYRNITHEADSHEVGVSVDQAFRRLP